MPTFLEFFAGGGMARAGLAPEWQSVWANDFSPEKAAIYARNWGAENLVVGDVAQVAASEVPDADMAWGSFPCQDLSLAGVQRGIGQEGAEQSTRSGAFWGFWNLVSEKQPPLVVLENVVGALTSNQGRDIQAICAALSAGGYRYGPLVMDAAMWVPQSRPRLFIVGVLRDRFLPEHFTASAPVSPWHTDAVCRAFATLDEETRRDWVWWNLPTPKQRLARLETLIEEDPSRWVKWDDQAKTDYLLGMMSEINREKLRQASAMKRRVVGLGYRRTRQNKQRLEVRFDGIAGCLRTAGGGSSKQIVIEVSGSRVRTRLLSPREAARLQGLSDDYWLPDNYNDAYDLVGDGLCVPVVAHLGATLLTPLAHQGATLEKAIA
jgi:DNA (cytosine-5)-methyltransferase 1